MTVTAKPNQRLSRLGWTLEHQAAVLHTAALDQIATDLNFIDGHPPTGEQLHISGGGDTSTVEAAAMRTADLNAHATKIRNSATALEHAVYNHMELCRRTVTAVPAAANATLCDGRRYEGQHLTWTPHSRDDNNGWNDPTCRDIAGPTGLCDACRLRMNNWRRRNNLPSIAVQDAA
jgi:hypothetical protein